MNWAGVRHLLASEWKRTRKYLILCWVVMLIGASGQILEITGIKAADSSSDMNEFFQGCFVLLSIHFAIWLGLSGTGWQRVKPLQFREIMLVKVILLFGGLLFPLLLVNGGSLLGLGFSIGTVAKSVFLIASLATALWCAWYGLSIYAGRYFLIVVIAVCLVGLQILSRLLQVRFSISSLVKMFGDIERGIQLPMLWILVALLLIAWRWAWSWPASRRTGLAIILVLVSMGLQRMLFSATSTQIPVVAEPAQKITEGRFVIGDSESKGVTVLRFQSESLEKDLPEGQMMTVKFADGGMFVAGETAYPAEDESRRDLLSLDYRDRNLALHRALPEGMKWYDGGRLPKVVDPQIFKKLEATHWLKVKMKDAIVRTQTALKYRGKIRRTIFQYRKILSVSSDKNAEYFEDGVKLQLSENRGNNYHEVDLRLATQSRVKDMAERFLYFYVYPRSGVIVSGKFRSSHEGSTAMGYRHRRWNLEFRDYFQHDFLGNPEIPELHVYRLEILSHCEQEIKMSELPLVDARSASDDGYEHQLSMLGIMTPGERERQLWPMRPDPRTANHEEVSAWLKAMGRNNYRPWRAHEASEFASRNGQAVMDFRENDACVLGLSEEMREAAIVQFSKDPKMAGVIARRGWQEFVHVETEAHLKLGKPENELAKLALLFNEPEWDQFLLGYLSNSQDPDFYRAMRRYPRFQKPLDELIAGMVENARSDLTDKLSVNSEASLSVDVLSIPLQHGSPEALDLLLELGRKAKIGGRTVYRPHRLKNSFPRGNGGSWLADRKVEEFHWDGVLQKWIFRKEVR